MIKMGRRKRDYSCGFVIADSMMLVLLLLVGVAVKPCSSFSGVSQHHHHTQQQRRRLSLLKAVVESNDSSPGNPPAKTYGSEAQQSPIRDMIDTEAAMKDFFTSREEWVPLFRSMAAKSTTCDAASYLEGTNEDDDDDDTTLSLLDDKNGPWKTLDAIPTNENDRQILAGFLDSAQQSLLDIPVSDSEKDDENDLHFLEEGRRMLAISRFHVVRTGTGSDSSTTDTGKGFGSSSSNNSLQSYDNLFETVWSEIMHFHSSPDEVEHTGSLILLPDYTSLSDLRRFTGINLLRPLQWLLGKNQIEFEISTIQRGDSSPAIRVLYKLADMPSLDDKE